MAEVVCLGILVADVIGRPIEALPARGTLRKVESIALHVGGCAANTGLSLQRLGVQTLVAGRVGRDALGDWVEGELLKSGAACAISRDEILPTSATMVLVSNDAERSFLHCVGANAGFSSEHFDESQLDGARWLHIAGHGLLPRFDGKECAALLQKARARGIRTSLDTAGAPDDVWRANLRECLPHLDVFLPGASEVEALFPESNSPLELAERVLQLGVGTVVLKMGERGCLVRSREDSFEVAAFAVEAIDATGAGDAFAAGFIAGQLRGLNLRESARLGNAVGALCVTRVGSLAGVASWNETFAWIEQSGR